MELPINMTTDEYGFLDGATDVDGVFAAGCAQHPCDVSKATKEATAAALRAIQCLKRG
jgi:heterodisulfide reductase subunit A-like polyferredoxin